MPFIRIHRLLNNFHPEYVLVLSGDHIYKMDYRRMLNQHKEKGADVTIAVFNVPIEEASRYGIMSTDENGKIYHFAESPKSLPVHWRVWVSIFFLGKF